MNRLRLTIAVIFALLLLEQCAKPLMAVTATFPTGSGKTLTETVGGITVTFSTTEWFSQLDQFGVTVDRSIKNEGFANYQLSFSTPIRNLSFDIGGIDTAWGDVVHSFTVAGAPVGLTIGPSTNSSQGFTRNMATWNGSQLVAGSQEDNGARVFFGPAVLSSLAFKSSGAASGSNHWILHDNFSFEAVPEPPATFLMTIAGCQSLICRRRRPVSHNRA